ncbi:hypothetical protein [Actinoplanes sp. NBRC 103695]|uniref:hypothetical protein n=1 Tax=Actinoplanes sp. NBRC 103695 TaxID=3032202 RepID=UPI0024A4B5B0|nr:hypothetical protein [Actinoplanes sp. NBRC 103695]GLZ01179.1 hypothetical protein Acsp02_84300 [Actinoplanes sp. NBRC 103695]
MMRLRPVPATTAPTVRMILTGGHGARSAFRTWLAPAGPRLEVHLLDNPAGIAPQLAALPVLTPTVVVVTAGDAAAGLAADADHLVVLGVGGPAPIPHETGHTRITVVAGSDLDRAGPELTAWCDIAPQVTVRILDVPDAELVRPRSPAADLLLALFRVNESYPPL